MNTEKPVTDKQKWTSGRKQITIGQVLRANQMTEKKLRQRLEEKGYGTLLSRHEILGVITEEYHELIGAVELKSLEEIRAELMDIAVGCIFGVACIDAETLDW